jgi:hypothetical protein
MKTKYLSLCFFMFFLILGINGFAQDLLTQLEKEEGKTVQFVTATFKGSRLINGHSIETTGKKELEFIFAHRFGRIRDGAYELFGLDQAFVRIGLQYGLSDRLSIGVGRNSVDKTVDGYFKYKLVRQQGGGYTIPFTVTWVSNVAVRLSPKKTDATYPIELEDRVAYTNQLLIARKFSNAFSLQLMPTLMHRNTVEQDFEENRLFAIGAGGRLKITRSMAVTSEYYHRVNTNENSPYYNSVGVGLDIETGGHVFQLVFTNTRGLT